MSLKSELTKYLERNKYLSMREIEMICKTEKVKISNAERRLREMTADGIIDPIYLKGDKGQKYVGGYQLKQDQNSLI